MPSNYPEVQTVQFICKDIVFLIAFYSLVFYFVSYHGIIMTISILGGTSSFPFESIFQVIQNV